jgi:hypothetical protein
MVPGLDVFRTLDGLTGLRRTHHDYCELGDEPLLSGSWDQAGVCGSSRRGKSALMAREEGATKTEERKKDAD